MAELLRLSSRNDWAKTLEKCHEEIENAPNATAARIRSMYGGMGSLNDVVFYRNGQALAAENSEFDMLRSELYQLCHGGLPEI